jgi:hypothetical protein
VTPLERSHAQLRGALIFAARRLIKLNFGKKNDPVVEVLRRVLREARVAAGALARRGPS